MGIRVVSPLLSFMLVGYVVRKIGWLEQGTFTKLNTLVFRLLMPILVFLNGSQADRGEIFSRTNVEVLLLALSGIAVILFLSLVICKRLISNVKDRAVIVQGIYRSNLILYGLPIILTIYGDGPTGTVSLLILFIVPTYNIIAAFLLGSATNTGKSGLLLFKQAFTNPLVVAALLGVGYNLLFDGLIPELLLEPLVQLSRTSTPLAFIVLGGLLRIQHLFESKRAVISVCALRLVLVPGVMILIGVSLGINGPPLAVLLAAFSAPVAVNSYTMAKNMGVSPELSGDLVAASTVLSMITVCGWVALLSFLRLI